MSTSYMEMNYQRLMDELRSAMREDASIAPLWHGQFVLAMMETGISHDSAHCAAAKIMRVTFGVETYPDFGKA